MLTFKPRETDIVFHGNNLVIRAMKVRRQKELHKLVHSPDALESISYINYCIAECVFMTDGSPAFATVDDVDDMDQATMLELFQEVQRWNAWSDDGKADVKKNSPTLNIEPSAELPEVTK